MVLFVLGMLVWRKLRGKWDIRAIYNPIFILAASGWTLGFVASRFWTDWGMPAAIFWVMAETSGVFDEKVEPASWRRGFAAIALCGISLY